MREAEVRKLSSKGTSSRDRELVMLEVQHAEGKEARRRAHFPSTMEELTRKVSIANVDIDLNQTFWKLCGEHQQGVA